MWVCYRRLCCFWATALRTPYFGVVVGLLPRSRGLSRRDRLCVVFPPGANFHMFCACHSQKGECFAPRSTFDVREIDWRATKERRTDRKPRDIWAGGVDVGRSLPMCLPQRSSYSGGMARRTCRAPKPTDVVTLGLSRVPPLANVHWSLWPRREKSESV